MHHKRGNIRQLNECYPYGLTWSSPEGLDAHQYQNKQWQQKEWNTSGLEMYDFHARLGVYPERSRRNPVLGRWQAPDPMNQFDSPYTAMGNNPVTMIDPDGMQSFVGSLLSGLGSYISKNYTIIVKSPRGPDTVIGGTFGRILQVAGAGVSFLEGDKIFEDGMKGVKNSGDPSWLKSTVFILNHPIISSEIGMTNVQNSHNISSTSERFPLYMRLNESGDYKLSQVNAFRHVLWQAIITEKYGFEIAFEIAFVHEEGRYIINQLVGSETYNFYGDDASDQADSAADQLNNIIGRTMGEVSKGSTRKEIVKRILDYYHDVGLWEGGIVLSDDGSFAGYKIQRVKLTDEDFNEALKKLENLDDDYGFPQEKLKKIKEHMDDSIDQVIDAKQHKF